MDLIARTLTRDALRREFSIEQQAGFATLKRIPSTWVVRFLDYFGTLPANEQQELADAMAERGSYYLHPPLPTVQPGDDANGRFQTAMQWRGFGGGLRYTPIKLLAGIAKDTQIGGVDGWCRAMGFTGQSLERPEELLPGPAAIAPVKAAQLRRRIEAALKTLFEPKPRNFGDEMWSYRGELEGCSVTLSVTYSRRLADADLRYGVVVGRGSILSSNFTCYESLFGAGNGRWDYITEENVDRSVALFVELLQWLVRFVVALEN